MVVFLACLLSFARGRQLLHGMEMAAEKMDRTQKLRALERAGVLRVVPAHHRAVPDRNGAPSSRPQVRAQEPGDKRGSRAPVNSKSRGRQALEKLLEMPWKERLQHHEYFKDSIRLPSLQTSKTWLHQAWGKERPHGISSPIG